MTQRNRGRPPSPKLHDRILVAALQLLASGGYEVLTMDEVARKARTTKTTVYKRFKDKDQLVEAAILHLSEQIASDTPPSAPDTERAVTTFRQQTDKHRVVEILAAAILAKRAHPKFAAQFRTGVLSPQLTSLSQELSRLGIERDSESLTMQAMGRAVVHAIGGELSSSHPSRTN
jgi:DNA-binding transcriptional regulator YbjK